MEEASSILKAIEKGWIQAGKPQEFSIKIFEEATKNFIGLTTKPAKIGIFFTEKVVHPQQQARPTRQREEYAKPAAPVSKKPFSQPQQQTNQSHTQRPLVKQHQQAPEKFSEERGEKKQRETWNPEMIEATRAWVKETLSLMDKPNGDFTLDTKNYYLKIYFPQPLFDNPEKERLLFRSFAHLIMQSLRNKFKKSFRGFKIILSSPNPN